MPTGLDDRDDSSIEDPPSHVATVNCQPDNNLTGRGSNEGMTFEDIKL